LCNSRHSVWRRLQDRQQLRLHSCQALLLLIWWHPEEVWYGFAAQLLRLLRLDQWYVLLLATAAAAAAFLLQHDYDMAEV
jgi:hypothetical protein